MGAATISAHHLMAHLPAAAAPAMSAVAIMDTFLEGTARHRAKRTYEWYQRYCQSFAETIPSDLTVTALKPFHLHQWLDQHPTWAPGNRRGAITAIQRAFRWAEKMGHIDRSPIGFVEKPKPGKREGIISPEEYERILSRTPDEAFSDLVTTAWETGCRPQEIIRVQNRHVDLSHARWVFPPAEAKVKTHPRIVYLPDTALAITERRLRRQGNGHLFRNVDGQPWTAYAVNCRFNRLQRKLGRKYCLYLFRHAFATRLLETGVDARKNTVNARGQDSARKNSAGVTILVRP